MADARVVKMADLENRLREQDNLLLKEMRRAVYLQENGATWANIEVEMGVIDQIQEHRRTTLWAYSNAGGNVRNAGQYGAYAVVTGDV